jgi:hypothetical protein
VRRLSGLVCYPNKYRQRGTIVFSPDSPATWSRGSIGSGGESSSMLTNVEGNAVQAFCTRKNALTELETSAHTESK